MTDDRLIKWQARKIADQDSTIEYLRDRIRELEKESVKTEPLSYPETVHALAHAEVPKCQTVTD